MRQILNVNIPKSWHELPDKELRFVFRLLQGEYSLPKIKTLCLLRWGHLKVVRREGAVFIVRYRKRNYPLSAIQIVQSTEALAWLGDFPPESGPALTYRHLPPCKSRLPERQLRQFPRA